MRRTDNLILIVIFTVFALFAVQFLFPRSSQPPSELQKHHSGSKAHHLDLQPKESLTAIINPKEQYASNPLVGGFWPSGRPYMDQKRKTDWRAFKYNSESDVKLEMGTVGDLHKPFQTILFEKSVWENQQDNANLLNRGSVTKFKPGVFDYKLIHSNQDGTSIYYFPYFEKYRPELTRIVDSVLGADMLKHVVRMQFARMAHDAKILKHQDTGEWATSTHRIHVPILVPPQTQFQVFMDDGRPVDLDLREGHVFELNNRVPHAVSNPGPSPRIHLVIDVSESPRSQFTTLHPGQECSYGQVIVC